MPSGLDLLKIAVVVMISKVFLGIVKDNPVYTNSPDIEIFAVLDTDLNEHLPKNLVSSLQGRPSWFLKI